MASATLTASLSFRFESEDGQSITRAQLREAEDCIEQAVRNRLLGDGFLPDDLELESWDVTFNTTNESH